MAKADSTKAPSKLETVTLKAFIHCEGCRRKIRRIIRVLDGVEDVEIDSPTGKVTVTGSGLDSKTILQRLQKYKKQAEVWPNANASPNAGAAKSAGGNQPKPANNNSTNPDTNAKKKNNAGGESGGKSEAAKNNESKKGGGKKEAEAASVTEKGEEVAPASEQKPNKSEELNASAEAGDENTPLQNGGGGGKKGKKGGNAGNNNGGGGSGNGSNNGGNGGASQQPHPHAAHDQPIASGPTSSVTVSANKSLAPTYDSVQTGYSDNNSVDYATHMFSDENANNCTIM